MDMNKIIKQNEEFIKEFDKRQEVMNQYFDFFEKDESLDAKVKAFKRMPYNKGVNLDEKLLDYFTQTGKEINKENLSSVISAISQINYTNQQNNSKFPLTPENIDKAISIQKGKERIIQPQEPSANIPQKPSANIPQEPSANIPQEPTAQKPKASISTKSMTGLNNTQNNKNLIQPLQQTQSASTTRSKTMDTVLQKINRKNQNTKINEAIADLDRENRYAKLNNRLYLPPQKIINTIINNINKDNYLQMQKIVPIMQSWGNQAQAAITAMKRQIVAEQKKISSGKPEKYSDTIIRANTTLLKDKEKDLNELNRSISQLESKIKIFAPAIPKPLNLDEINRIQQQQPLQRSNSMPVLKPQEQFSKLQKDNINTSDRSNNTLKTTQNWFSEKLSNISRALSNPFQLASSESTSNISITNANKLGKQSNIVERIVNGVGTVRSS
jgi:hypothetical protein